MAGRSGRDRLIAARDDPRRGRRLALRATHVAIALLLGLASLALFGDSTMFTGVVALLFVGELVLLLLAGSIAALYDRYAALVLVDVGISTPIVAGLSRSGSVDPGAVGLIAFALAVCALGGSILAALPVRTRSVERVVLAVALVAVAAVFWESLIAAIIPLAALAVVAAPKLPSGARARSAAADPAPAQRRSGRRSARPDAAAILAARRADDALSEPAADAARDER